MTGPFAALLAALVGAASAFSGIDCTAIVEEAEARIEAENQKEEASKYLIAIDPGHQGRGNFEQEPIGPGSGETKNKVAGGTSGVSSGVPEYELTLDIGLQLRDALLEKGYEVLMIRETHDVDISNSERALMANEANADVFVRLHGNGSVSSSARGAVTMCQTPSNPYNGEYYEASRELSEKIIEAYTEVTGISNMGIQETDSMSGINWCTVPVTILEMGFMTNPDEDELMQDDEFQLKMVDGIVQGIENYLEGKEPSEKKTELSGVSATTEEAAAADTGMTAEADEGTTAEEAAAADTGATAESAQEEEPEEKEETIEKETMGDDKFRGFLTTTLFTPARKTAGSVKELRRVVRRSAAWVEREYEKETYAKANEKINNLKENLEQEIGKYSGEWSLYMKIMDSGASIGINEDKAMVAASLIKLFVAGEFYSQVEQGVLDEEDFGNLPDIMISISDNGSANSLINAVGMDDINEFAQKNGFVSTKINRRMLEFNGTENYTSAKDCGKMLEQVLKGKYVNKKASARLLESLKDQQKTSKIPAGVPDEVETANKTGELSNVDNDAAIVWSPAGTYILVIMNTGGGNRIQNIVQLSRLVYDTLNE